ncbi:hypothetical protein CK203_076999 [Vitis vinifera]|uniref:Endonuclease/exonuclease/phosphatase domain-containing protein n=1 Tax=Vitis vinifera TaxID=29760 RepID=A0A438DZI3_VITVI|nr:hypothetical protein CK203_076999 [Vitis vinifera]
MPTKVFEVEILTSLKKMKMRKEQKAQSISKALVAEEVKGGRGRSMIQSDRLGPSARNQDSGDIYWFALFSWHGQVLKLIGLEVGEFLISCWFKNCEDNFCWVFSGVYVLTVSRYKEAFQEELGAIRGLWQVPWCVSGDFNISRFPMELDSNSKLSSAMRRFSEITEELEFRDLPLQRGSFTWRGCLNFQSQSRLDRFLVLEGWESHFSGVAHSLLPRPISDQHPILLDKGGLRKGLTPFRKEIGFESGDVLRFYGRDQALNYGGVESLLEASFSKEEVFKALLDLSEDKAPSSDGFSLVLIPKKGVFEDLKDFKPSLFSERDAHKLAWVFSGFCGLDKVLSRGVVFVVPL